MIANRIDSLEFDAWARSRGVQCVYLYGSTARGRARPDSDVDLGIMLGSRPGWEEAETVREEAVRELARALHLPAAILDVRIVDRAPLYFQFRVIAHRRCLWTSDPLTRTTIEVRIMREYYDFKYFEDQQVSAMHRQIEEGTYGRRPTPARSTSP